MGNRILNIRLTGICLAFGFSATMAVIPNTISFLSAFTNGTANVTFSRPVFFTQIPGLDSTYAVLEQQMGNAIVVHRRNGAWVKDTLVHIPVVSNQNEMGFLGLAFHPNFAASRKYYVYYSKSFSPATAGSADCGATPTVNMNCGLNVLEERATDSTLIKDAGVAPRQILSVTKSAMNHDGGDIAFGPNDGYLYVGIGDGGDPQGDTAGRGQNPDTLLGKFLRVDVDNPANGLQYGIPATNPFVNNSAYRHEIFALGIRNPWRWSFDALTGTIWAGDVGNASFEEVDTVAIGENLGWAMMEGFGCQPNIPKYANCNKTGMTLPIAAYPHNTSDTSGNAIIGGYVYRGNPSSPYYGMYFYGDNGSGEVWVMQEGANGRIQQRLTLHPTPTATSAAVPTLSAFGEDSNDNLYALALGSGASNGVVYLLSSPDLLPVSVLPNAARAFSPMSLRDLSGLDLYDLQGRRIPNSALRNGIYVVKSPGANAPALVPVLK